MYSATRLAVSVLDSIVDKGVIAHIERKHMTNVDKIMGFISNSKEPVTVKQLHEALDIKQSLLSGTLVMLVKTKRLEREKIERINGNGPKMQWAYKVVANPQQAS